MDLDLPTFVTAILGAGGGGAVISFFAFRRFGEAWLDARFAEKIEAFRHEKAKELEKLRADIDGSLRSRLRLQERQFESMVNIWGVLKNAQEKLGVLLSPLQSYSDIRRMDAEARQEYMQSFDLQEWQRKEILASGDVQKSFSSMIDRKRFNEAAIAFNVYDKATRANEIFFSEEIFTKLRSIADCMHSALVDKELSLDDADRALSQSAWKTFEKDCIPKVGEFASFARKLLSETEQASKQ